MATTDLKPVCLVGRSSDPHLQIVGANLAALGRRYYVVECDLENVFAATLEGEVGDGWKFNSDLGARPYSGIWWRPNFNCGDAIDDDVRANRLILSSHSNAIESLGRLGGSTVINAPEACGAQKCALNQLSLARQVGLRVPNSLFTNDFDRLLEWSRAMDEIVVKAASRLDTGWEGESSFAHEVSSNIIDKRDLLEARAAVESAPMIYQERLPKEYDVRVAVIGRRSFAFRMDSPHYKSTELNWEYDPGVLDYEMFDLPSEINNTLFDYMSRAELFEAHFNLLQLPKGELIFISCDPQGQWSWLDPLTDGSIGREIALGLTSATGGS